MGVYLNPRNGAFKESVEKEIYVDKSLLIQRVWENAKHMNKYICISRPRRFGKSTDANMLTAYFSRGCDSQELFDGLKIAEWNEYGTHRNRHNIIHLNMQFFLSASKGIDDMLGLLSEEVTEELADSFGIAAKRNDLSLILEKIFVKTGESFIFIIDEWDCVFREFKEDKASQKAYLDYLRLLLKDHAYVEFAYMTGILPIKKYGTHSALNMFDEISMVNAEDYASFMGFTGEEVKGLCEKYGVDFGKMQEWYDGYHLTEQVSVYSPRSVTASIGKKKFGNYWSQTETYEALKVYIDLDYDGLKSTVIDLLAGKEVLIDTLSFQNDMSTFASRDDVLTLLVHLGYLAYRCDTGYAYIPNNEVKDIFITSIKRSDWSYITKVFQNANALLEAVWNGQEERVAEYIEQSHYETSVLQYNDENALSYTVSLAFITAKEHYTMIRELPAGKGFADIVFFPKKEKPAMLVELKYDKEADSGICQIKEKKYYLGLEKYLDNLLLVSISYDRTTKKHDCVIEKYEGKQG